MALWPSLPLHHARTQQKVSKNQLFTLATPRDCRPQSAILKYKYKQYQLANCSGKSNDGWTTFGRRHRRDATQQLWSSLFWSDIGQVHHFRRAIRCPGEWFTTVIAVAVGHNCFFFASRRCDRLVLSCCDVSRDIFEDSKRVDPTNWRNSLNLGKKCMTCVKLACLIV